VAGKGKDGLADSARVRAQTQQGIAAGSMQADWFLIARRWRWAPKNVRSTN